MSEIALYRKYRPSKFADVVGQEHVVKILTASLASGKVAHAYLFTGGRGIGKTTIARIIATELGTSANDIYEIDAASNRGIDDIRELREGVRTLPFDSKYKVYIIDEVHMLTKEAFNALLKTLEEPPAHVIFILATTEFEKVPETIVSRCQSFVLKKPSEAVISETVLTVAKKEKISLDKSGAELIAILADGSFRDALGVLQKVSNISNNPSNSSGRAEKITREDIEVITGAPRDTLINEVVSSIAKGDLPLGLSTVSQASADNVDMKLFTKLVIHKMRQLLLLRYAPEMKKLVADNSNETEMAFYKTMLAEKGGKITSGALLELLQAYNDNRSAFIAELPLELALIRILGQDK